MRGTGMLWLIEEELEKISSMLKDQVNLELSTRREILLNLETNNNSKEDPTQILERDPDSPLIQEIKRRSILQELESHPCPMSSNINLIGFQDCHSPRVVQMCQAQAFWIHGIRFQSNSNKWEETHSLLRISTLCLQQYIEDLLSLILMRTRKSSMTWCCSTLKNNKKYYPTRDQDFLQIKWLLALSILRLPRLELQWLILLLLIE